MIKFKIFDKSIKRFIHPNQKIFGNLIIDNDTIPNKNIKDIHELIKKNKNLELYIKNNNKFKLYKSNNSIHKKFRNININTIMNNLKMD